MIRPFFSGLNSLNMPALEIESFETFKSLLSLDLKISISKISRLKLPFEEGKACLSLSLADSLKIDFLAVSLIGFGALISYLAARNVLKYLLYITEFEVDQYQGGQ